jgi:hypothetical protein
MAKGKTSSQGSSQCFCASVLSIIKLTPKRTSWQRNNNSDILH